MLAQLCRANCQYLGKNGHVCRLCPRYTTLETLLWEQDLVLGNYCVFVTVKWLRHVYVYITTISSDGMFLSWNISI